MLGISGIRKRSIFCLPVTFGCGRDLRMFGWGAGSTPSIHMSVCSFCGMGQSTGSRPSRNSAAPAAIMFAPFDTFAASRILPLPGRFDCA